MKPTIRQVIVTRPDTKKISMSVAVKLLAHMKSPRNIAQTRLRNDIAADTAAVFFVADIAVMISEI